MLEIEGFVFLEARSRWFSSKAQSMWFYLVISDIQGCIRFGKIRPKVNAFALQPGELGMTAQSRPAWRLGARQLAGSRFNNFYRLYWSEAPAVTEQPVW